MKEIWTLYEAVKTATYTKAVRTVILQRDTGMKSTALSRPIIGQKGKYMKTIEKKILPKYFKDIKDHGKCFEIREDNDGIQVGDIVFLREWDGEKYTGAYYVVTVRYVLRNIPEYGLKDGYCIFCWDIRSISYVL